VAPLQRLFEQVLPRPRLRSIAFGLLRRLRPLQHGRLRRLPAPPRARRFAPHYPAPAPARGDVSLFIGCLGAHQDAAAAAAAITLLNRLGWNVHLPTAQVWCGTLHRHAGNARDADVLAAKNRSAFPPTLPGPVLTLASGCHEAVAQTLTRPDAAPRVVDAFDFIATDVALDRLRFRPWTGSAPVALHLPCTQRNVLRTSARVAPLLARIPGIVLQALPDSGCCGAAGSHMALHPARADALRAPGLDAVAADAAATLCSANVGCRLHLQAGLEQRRLAVAVRHPLELLAEHLE
jgi:glycolate oxidase iron-sulfur subunit